MRFGTRVWGFGKFLVLVGAYKASTWVAFLTATGVVLGAAYALWLYRRVVFGPLTDVKAFPADVDLTLVEGAVTNTDNLALARARRDGQALQLRAAARRLAAETDRPLTLLGNGVEWEHFATPRPEPPELAALPRPRIGYVGLLSHFLDFDNPPLPSGQERRRHSAASGRMPRGGRGCQSAVLDSPPPGSRPGGDRRVKLPARVTISEVGPRDGFQIEPEFIPTARKIEVVDRLAESGLSRIEVTSFVHPKAVPQLRDAEQVMAGIRRRPGTRYAALVPNDKGAVRAVDAGVDEVHTVVSASESHNLANVNMTIAESLEKLRAVMQVAERARVPVASGISTSFGCPFEGEVPLARLEGVVRRLVDIGARAIGLADTTGMANPRQITRTLEHLMPRFPAIEWTLHTHDTRAMAIPNILAALELGVTNIDASIGGLGGCPFAPGASGNVCSEDLVHCLHVMGVETGIDLDRLIAVSRRVQDVVGRALPGQIVKAGKADRRHPPPDTVAARMKTA